MSQDYGSEQKSADIYGKKQPLSGSTPESKMDIRGEGAYSSLLGENKATRKDSYSINYKKLILKGRMQASQARRTPFWVLDFVEYGQPGRLVMCEETYWIKIHEEIQHLKQKLGEDSSHALDK